MSHFTQVKTKITDITTLKKALEELGYGYIEGDVKVRGWRGITERADLAVSTGSPYNIGFRRSEDGSYEVIADWWGVQSRTGLSERAFVRNVNQRYAYHKVVDEVTRRGYMVSEDEVTADNTIRLVVRKWS